MPWTLSRLPNGLVRGRGKSREAERSACWGASLLVPCAPSHYLPQPEHLTMTPLYCVARHTTGQAERNNVSVKETGHAPWQVTSAVWIWDLERRVAVQAASWAIEQSTRYSIGTVGRGTDSSPACSAVAYRLSCRGRSVRIPYSPAQTMRDRVAWEDRTLIEWYIW